MALRLAGEEYSVVQGLDALGWPREVEANDADPGIKITQSGSGPALQVISGDVDVGANQIKTTDLYLEQISSQLMGLKKISTGYNADLQLNTVSFGGGLAALADGIALAASNVDGRFLRFNARDNGVGTVEVARMQGAADPYFQATLPIVLNPSSQPGTIVEGHFWYDSTAKKLKFYNGTGVETVTSA